MEKPILLTLSALFLRVTEGFLSFTKALGVHHKHKFKMSRYLHNIKKKKTYFKFQSHH